MQESPGLLGLYLSVSSLFLFAAALLPLWRIHYRWVRIFDFPILQFSAWAAFNIFLLAVFPKTAFLPPPAVLGLLLAVILLHGIRFYPYTVLHRVQALAAPAGRDRKRDFSLLIANVLMTNRGSREFLALVERNDPDLLLVNEPDSWWENELRPLDARYPHAVKVPQDNTYGMIFYSRLPVLEQEVLRLVEEGVPSIRLVLKLPSGHRFQLFCVHPRPPSEEDTAKRDAELLVVGKRLRQSPLPGVVAGDMNDVAWSRSTRLFQRTSQMLDPRIGRGFFNSFHAHLPFLRYSLDHVFYTQHFLLVDLKRLPKYGSDHFPIFIRLHHEPGADALQDVEDEKKGDKAEVRETLEEARADGGKAVDIPGV